MRISDWSSDVCSSDLGKPSRSRPPGSLVASVHRSLSFSTSFALVGKRSSPLLSSSRTATSPAAMIGDELIVLTEERSEEHTSELQTLMRISYAVLCFKKYILRSKIKHTNDIIQSLSISWSV